MSLDSAALREQQTLWRSRLAATEALSSRALQREKDGDFNAAYNLCLQAARSYLWLLRNASGDNVKKDLKIQSARLLHRAERIKQSRPHLQSTPISRIDEFEQSAILDHSSVVRGRIYRQWTPQVPSELLGDSLYSDSDGHFRLSREQEDALDSFRRISELSKTPCILSESADPRRIWQSCITDCTVITSLISCLQHSQRFGSQICQNLLFPQDARGKPVYNANGKYIARLAVNGTWRAIEIDDYLPVDDTSSLLCAYMEPEDDYWAALLEKAFVKVQGGYRIPGSDPGSDVYTFSGWIPESLPLRQRDFRGEQLWKRLYTAFNRGECLLTLGSGSQNIHLPDGRTLASKHAFAVLAVEEGEDQGRHVEIIDPWVAKDPDATSSHMPALRLDWQFICSHFAALYCNWKPDSFEYQDKVHAKCTASDAVTFSVQLGPSANIERDEIWLLLSKHSDDDIDREFFTLQVREDTNGQFGREDAKHDFTNSPHILVKCRPERNQALLHVTMAKVGPRQETSFTLGVFADCPFEVMDSGQSLPHSKTVQGIWDEQSSGGNPTSHAYISNPHFSLTVTGSSPAIIEATLQTDAPVPVNLKMFKQAAVSLMRLQQYETAALVADSGAYSYRVATLFTKDLPTGQYLLVPSTFASGEHSDFSLRIKSSTPLGEIALLPAEDSGKFKRVLRGELKADAASRMKDVPSWQRRYAISPSQVSSISLRVRQIPTAAVPLNVAIYSSDEHGDPMGCSLSTSGAYAAYVAGTTTQPTKLRPSMTGYVAVVTAVGPQPTGSLTRVSFELTVLSDHSLTIREV